MIQKNVRIRILFGYIILMAVIGSMAAILVHERGRMREIELESVEIRKIRQDISTAHLYITGLAISGEGVIGWEKTDYLHYRNQLLQTDSLLQSLKSYSKDFVHPAQIDTLRILLADKEEHLRHIMSVFERQEEADSLLVNHLPEVAKRATRLQKKPLQTHCGLQGLILILTQRIKACPAFPRPLFSSPV